MRSIPTLCAIVTTLALPIAATAQAKDPNGANPTDIATPKAGQGAIIDKTPGAAASSGAATNDMRSMQGAKAGASGASKARPARKPASSAM